MKVEKQATDLISDMFGVGSPRPIIYKNAKRTKVSVSETIKAAIAQHPEWLVIGGLGVTACASAVYIAMIVKDAVDDLLPDFGDIPGVSPKEIVSYGLLGPIGIWTYAKKVGSAIKDGATNPIGYFL